MRAGETTLAGLLDGKKQFQVPLFQRPYSWEETQLKQLWLDILEQAELVAEEAGGSTHFLGSVVHAPSPLNTMAFAHTLVVDGQQRLTTLSLALAALRDHLRDTDSEWAAEIDRRFLINPRTQGDEALKLLPTQFDREIYREHITGTTPSGSESRVGHAYRFFRSKLAEVAADEDAPSLEQLEEAITSRLILVEVNADERDNVYRIFQSLNNTGLDLTQADLLRNYLFMHLPTRGEALYERLWTPLQRDLKPKEIEHLIWLQLILDGENRVRRQDIYNAEQVRFAKSAQTEQVYEDYIKELVRRSAHYVVMVNPETESDPEVRAALTTLRRWDAEVIAPPVMLLFDQREKGGADSGQVARALRIIESFLVRRMMCRVSSNGLNRIFMDLPSQLSPELPVDDAIHQALSATRRSWPTDEELIDAVLSKPFYLYGRATQRTFVLRRLEESYEHPEPVDFAAAKLTVEHVLPQTPSSDWLDVLAEDAPPGEDPAEIHERLVHTLGNLTLTAQNTKLSNHPFDRKKGLLNHSHLELNRQIAETSRWGAAEIEARGRELAKTAIELWPAPLPGIGRVERGRDWSLLHQALAALPYGAWTTYGELAALIGTAPQPVGNHLTATTGVVNAWRVLDHNGRVAAAFRWSPGGDRGDVHDVLRVEGVRFDETTGKADPKQRLSAEALAALLDLGGDEDDNE
jgi:alkylated DNA nucleotide flippase Atl1